MGNEIVKLVKKVKKMEKVVKSRRVVLTDSEDEIKTKRRNVKTEVRRRLDAKDVSYGFEDVSTALTDIKSAS
ncbi:hypothetical protein Tco_1379818, partial [Tanacetum coccineum]